MASYGAAAASAAATAVLAEAAAAAACTPSGHPWQVLAESVARRPLRRTGSGGHISGAPPDLFMAAAAFNTYRGYERVCVLGRGQHSVAVLLRSPASGKQVVSKHPNPNPYPYPCPWPCPYQKPEP